MGRDLRFYHTLAQQGATVRLMELEQERQKIYNEFPDLQPNHKRTHLKVVHPKNARKPRGMSPEARREISVRMKNYWAKRRQSKEEVAK